MSTWNGQNICNRVNRQRSYIPFSWWQNFPYKNDTELLKITEKLNSWGTASDEKSEAQTLNDLCCGVAEWKLICVLIDRAISCSKLKFVKEDRGVFTFAFPTKGKEVHRSIVFPESTGKKSDSLPAGVECAARYSEFVDSLLKSVYREYSCIIVEAHKEVTIPNPPLGEGIILDANTENSGTSEEFEYQIDCMIRCQENLSMEETSSEYLVDTITIDLKRTNGKVDWNSVKYKYEKMERQLTSEIDIKTDDVWEKIKNANKEEVKELISHLGNTEAKNKIFDCFLKDENSMLHHHLENRIEDLRSRNKLALAEEYNRNVYLNIFPLNIFISQMPEVTYRGHIRRKGQVCNVTLTLKIDALKAENLDWIKCLIAPQKDINEHTVVSVLPPDASGIDNKVELGDARFVVALDEECQEWLTILPAGDAQKRLCENNHIDYAVIPDDWTEETKPYFKGQFVLHSATQTVEEGTYLRKDIEICQVTNTPHFKNNFFEGLILKSDGDSLLPGRYYKNEFSYLKRKCTSCGQTFFANDDRFSAYKKSHALLKENDKFWCEKCDGQVIDNDIAIFKDSISKERYSDEVNNLKTTFLCKCGKYFYRFAAGVEWCNRCGTLYCPDCAKTNLNSSSCTECKDLYMEDEIWRDATEAEMKFIIKKVRRYLNLRDRFKRISNYNVKLCSVVGKRKYEEVKVNVISFDNTILRSYKFYYDGKKSFYECGRTYYN